MTHRYMLDTNVVSDIMKRPGGGAAGRIADIEPGGACISIIVAAELRFGAHKAGSAKLWQQISDFTSFIPVLPFEHNAEDVYARVRSELETRGTPIGPNDMLIAAHALALGLTLVTDNTREFSRVPGLKVENWLD